jgi:hypothetical protein
MTVSTGQCRGQKGNEVMADERDQRDGQDGDDDNDDVNEGERRRPAATGPLSPQNQGVTFSADQQVYLDHLLAEAKRNALDKFKNSDAYRQTTARARRTDELEGETRQQIETLQTENARLKAERAQALSKAEASLARAQMVAILSQRGVPSERIQDALILADKSNLKVDLDQGVVTGAEESVQALIESRPWMVGPGISPQHTQRERPQPVLNGGTTGQPVTNEARIAQVMQEMAARGHGRL